MNAVDRDQTHVQTHVNSMHGENSTSAIYNKKHVCSDDALMISNGFYCGACGQDFPTICQVHEHMQGKHMSKGSYHYNSFLRTAFPKYDSVCCFTQTIHEDEERHSDGSVSVSSSGIDSDKQADSGEKQVDDDPSTCIVSKDGNHSFPKGFKANGQHKGNKCTAGKMGVKALIKGQKVKTRALNCGIAGDVALSGDRENVAEGQCNKRKRTRKQIQKVTVSHNKKQSKVSPVINDGAIIVNVDDAKKLCGKKSRVKTLKTSKRTVVKLPKKTKKKALREKGESVKINDAGVKKNKLLLEKSGGKFGHISVNDSEIKSEVVEGVSVEYFSCSKAGQASADTKLDDHFPIYFENHQSEILEQQELDIQVTAVGNSLKNTSRVSKKNCSSANSYLDMIKSDSLENCGKRRDLSLPYTCEICGQVMPWSKRDVHQRLHSGERPFICELCGKGLISQTKLRRHMLIHSEVKKHTCDICGAGFQMKYKLRMHMHIHTGKKPYLCSICGAEFNHSSNLATHNRCVHLQIKPFECKVCGGKYAKRSQLDDHLLSHSSDKQFICRFCGKSFKYSKGLKRHEKNHLEQKPLKCKICQTSFTDQAKFTEHVSTAHDDPPIKCAICGKTFKDKEALGEHKASECDSKKYKCAICGEGYKLCNQYYTHMLAAHGIDKDQAKMIDDQRKKTNMHNAVTCSNTDTSSTAHQNFLFPMTVSDRDVPYPNSFTVTNSVLNPSLSVTQMVTGLLEENRSTIGALTRAATENLRLHSQDIPDEEKLHSVLLPSMNSVIIADRNQTSNYYNGSNERILIEPLRSATDLVNTMNINPTSSSLSTGQHSLLDNESSLAVGRLAQNAVSVELPKVLFTGSSSQHIQTNARNESTADTIPAIAGYRIQNLY